MICSGCGTILSEQHWRKDCLWVTCNCGHERYRHVGDGCDFVSGRGLGCPCKGFKPTLTYNEFIAYSKRLEKDE